MNTGDVGTLNFICGDDPVSMHSKITWNEKGAPDFLVERLSYRVIFKTTPFIEVKVINYDKNTGINTYKYIILSAVDENSICEIKGNWHVESISDKETLSYNKTLHKLGE
jgi:hypothetical protein